MNENDALIEVIDAMIALVESQKDVLELLHEQNKLLRDVLENE